MSYAQGIFCVREKGVVDIMADPTTELAKEFLEFHNYLVRKETKFFQNRELKGTPSDIDIIAVRPMGPSLGDLEVENNIIAEVKNWQITKEETLVDIYDAKFKFIDENPRTAWKQLKKYLPNRKFDKILFCLATTEKVHDYAWEQYGILIITTGFMIKQIAQLFRESDRRWSYYPERYNYNVIRSIMYYLYNCYKWKDKLLIEDLVWVDPVDDPRYRNNFVKLNSKFFEEFVYRETDSTVLTNLIDRLANKYPTWFKRKLKSNKKFWKYLTGKR